MGQLKTENEGLTFQASPKKFVIFHFELFKLLDAIQNGVYLAGRHFHFVFTVI